MMATKSAAIIDIQDLRQQKNILDEAVEIVVKSVSTTVTSQRHRASVCGCRGCKAQALEAAEWAAEMFEAA